MQSLWHVLGIKVYHIFNNYDSLWHLLGIKVYHIFNNYDSQVLKDGSPLHAKSTRNSNEARLK